MTLPSDQEKLKQIDVFYMQALTLAKVVMRILTKKASISLSKDPDIVKKPITEFMQRMRVSSLEKFETTTYISTINFYGDDKALKEHRALGAIVLYVEEEYIVELLSRLNYPDVNTFDEEAIEDACGTFCNLIAGSYKNGLTQLGFKDLTMSHFSSYRNYVLNGVEYCYGQKFKYEICLEVNGIKRIYLDLTMGPTPLAGS